VETKRRCWQIRYAILDASLKNPDKKMVSNPILCSRRRLIFADKGRAHGSPLQGGIISIANWNENQNPGTMGR
jgi:hypothetical protein